jgi:hypothetical protein
VGKRRPNFTLAVRALIRDVVAHVPEFAHIKASRIVVVAGEARRSSRGTVKPLTFASGRMTDGHGRRKPLVRLKGKRMLYCITLRPLFFRASSPKDRIETVLHELFHISEKCDGTLDPGRRHARLGRDFAKKLKPILDRYLQRCPAELWSSFAFDGDVQVQQWLERPPPTLRKGQQNARRVYTEEQLFLGPVRMVTHRTKAARLPRTRIKLH